VSTLWYGLKQGIKSIIQNKIFSLAAIGTITACLFLLGVFYSLFTNFQHMVYNAESTVSITVFFDENATQAQIDSIGQEIEACHQVEKVDYVSGEEAWARFKEDMLEGQSELVEAFGTDNPLADSSSYEVYLNDVSEQASLVEYIQGLNGVRKVNGSANAASGFNSFNMLIGYVSASIILLLILISIFLIYSAVDMGINVRKDEIAIMKLIGATDLFVRLPFIVEGIVMGLIGAAIPLVLLRVLYERVVSFIMNHFSTLSDWLTFLDTRTVFYVLIPLSLGIGVGIGVLGSTMSVRKHLQV
jgi:cell division transport system permease protein